jgi:hypothetical protein
VTSIDIAAEQLEAQLDTTGYKCFCQAWSATGGTLKSRMATIEIACKPFESIDIGKKLSIHLIRYREVEREREKGNESK